MSKRQSDSSVKSPDERNPLVLRLPRSLAGGFDLARLISRDPRRP